MKKLLLVAPLFLSGCAGLIIAGILAAGAIGVGAYSYSDNILSREYEAGRDDCLEGVRRALKSLDMPLFKEETDTQRTLVTSRTLENSVEIRLYILSEKKTKVSIKTADFATDAHKEMSQKVHEQLYKELTGNWESNARFASGAVPVKPAANDPAPSSANDITEEYVIDYERVWTASLAAAKRMEFKNQTSSRDALKGVIRCQRADGSPVEIAVEKLQKGGCRVSVRMGTGRGQEHSEAGRAVHDQIKKELGAK